MKTSKHTLQLPSQSDVDIRLLIHLGQYRQPTEPRKLYGPLADDFKLTQEQRHIPRPGRNKSEPAWNNLVQFARRRLVDQGLIDNSRKGFWSLTAEGRKRADLLATASAFDLSELL